MSLELAGKGIPLTGATSLFILRFHSFTERSTEAARSSPGPWLIPGESDGNGALPRNETEQWSSDKKPEISTTHE